MSWIEHSCAMKVQTLAEIIASKKLVVSIDSYAEDKFKWTWSIVLDGGYENGRSARFTSMDFQVREEAVEDAEQLARILGVECVFQEDDEHWEQANF